MANIGIKRVSKKTPLLGEILLQCTELTEEKLSEALKIKEKTGGRLGDILIKKKYILPHELMKAVCMQVGIEYRENLDPTNIDTNIIKDISINYAKSQGILPIEKTDSEVVIVLEDPFNLDAIKDMGLIFKGLNIHPVISSPMRVQDAINRVYERVAGQRIENISEEEDDDYDLEGPIDILDATEDEAPVIRFVNSVIHRAVKEKASDIHFEPFEKEVMIRYRVDGVLRDILHQPKKVHAAISSRIKIMGNLDIAEKRLPQDGRIFRKVAGKEIDIRLSTIPTQFGERLVMRILEKSSELMSLQKLGFDQEALSIIDKLIFSENGILLITGPTGSGKSTTMAAALSKRNNPNVNILTVEDPIEYQLHGVGQVQVNAKIGLSFASALRSFLRQDPDIIMVGEIRDTETADLAITAALTGHLVFSSMHTNASAGSFPRMIDMGIEPFLVASSVQGVLAQRLVRKVCTDCRESYQASNLELKELRVSAIKGPITLYREKGCPKCNHTGYSGRINVYEILIMNDAIRSLIMDQSDASKIRKAAVESGMLTMHEDGARKVLSGITTIKELARILSDSE